MKYIIIVFVFFFSGNIYSQTIISSAGKTSSNDNFIISWTLGETLVATLQNENTNLTQGFHQPLMVEISPASLEDDMVLDMVAYPNPTYNKVLFKGGDPTGTYHLRLVDKLGRVLEQKSVPSDQLEIEMGKYNNGSYLIEVVEDKSEKRVIFNIVKTSQ
tara:strand:- start:3 stop:479 length:477 start_codon:yes stop_codon:yes gene_type:complete